MLIPEPGRTVMGGCMLRASEATNDNVSRLSGADFPCPLVKLRFNFTDRNEEQQLPGQDTCYTDRLNVFQGYEEINYWEGFYDKTPQQPWTGSGVISKAR